MKLSTLINTARTAREFGLQKAVDNLCLNYVDPKYFPIVESKFGDRYCNTHVDDLVDILETYRYLPDKDDVVFDVGAMLGGFTVPASKRAKRVYSFEPLYYKELCDNVALNPTGNVKTYELALGITGIIVAEYFKTKTVNALTFKGMRDLTGDNPTFLKCNCEGAEWRLIPNDFDGVNTIEIQFHYSKNIIDNPQLLDWLLSTYTCIETIKEAHGINGIYRTRTIHGKIRKD
jgi:hypothetical protein